MPWNLNVSITSHLLGIVEFSSVGMIFNFGRLSRTVKSSELLFLKLCCINGFEAVDHWLFAFYIFAVDGGSCGVSERFANQIFRPNLRDEASVSGNVLGFDVGSRSARPVIAKARIICEHDRLVFVVLRWRVCIEVALGVLWLANTDIDVVVGGLVSDFGNDLVDVASCAAVYFVFLWHVPRVARQVLLFVIDVNHFSY